MPNSARRWRRRCSPPPRPSSTRPACTPSCANALAGFKVPRVVAFHAELPREDTGKIFKRRLREPYWAGRERRI